MCSAWVGMWSNDTKKNKKKNREHHHHHYLWLQTAWVTGLVVNGPSPGRVTVFTYRSEVTTWRHHDGFCFSLTSVFILTWSKQRHCHKVGTQKKKQKTRWRHPSLKRALSISWRHSWAAASPASASVSPDQSNDSLRTLPCRFSSAVSFNFIFPTFSCNLFRLRHPHLRSSPHSFCYGHAWTCHSNSRRLWTCSICRAVTFYLEVLGNGL